MPDSLPRRSARTGCLIVVTLVGLVLATGVTVLVIARAQVADARPERRAIEPALAPLGAGDEPVRLELDIAVARLVVVPARAGGALMIESLHDPRRHELAHEAERAPDGTWTHRLRFAPRSRAMALLRVKVGGEPPELRIRVPRGLPLAVFGRTEGSFAAIELAGLSVSSLDLDVRGGAVTLSVLEPLAAPMESLRLRGDKGSLEVSGLGNASPRSTAVRHRLGEIDLDLRGAWACDADVLVEALLAGGSLWLPEGVDVVDHDEPRPEPDVEDSRPRLRLDLRERGGRLVVVH